MRLFIAIDIPDDLKKMIDSLRADIPGARWVRQEQIHLTLAFLGEVDEPASELLIAELARIRLPEFKLCFSGTGCFPHRRHPRVLWVGLEPQPYLNILAAEVREAALVCGISQEERSFTPHITIARLSLSHSPELDLFVERNKALKHPQFTVHNFILYQSRLMSQGAEHIPVRSFPLNAVATVT